MKNKTRDKLRKMKRKRRKFLDSISYFGVWLFTVNMLFCERVKERVI